MSTGRRSSRRLCGINRCAAPRLCSGSTPRRLPTVDGTGYACTPTHSPAFERRLLMEAPPGLRFSRDGGVATITLNRPERLNAITWDMVRGITAFVTECGAADDVRVIVITGNGRAFSSGD